MNWSTCHPFRGKTHVNTGVLVLVVGGWVGAGDLMDGRWRKTRLECSVGTKEAINLSGHTAFYDFETLDSRTVTAK